jgi:quercetin dioxygenase-like cupin family protein
VAGAALVSPTLAQLGGDDPAPSAVRVTHAEGPAAGAPGRTLTLASVVVPPGATLARHRHPGTQVAVITAGRLTYTVHTGTVRAYRRGADGDPVLWRALRAGSTTVLPAGTSLVEQPGSIHRAANRGRTPVRITLSMLAPNGSPPAIAVPAR